ncbi:CDT1-like protein a, chloroplastic [Chenopodium quinoa]|uniref:CDT1 Geminin-binding domain-containing protein n=1 Tax=Chenopodium quinoa TaxID=63459 RepID=A0A803LFD4_CHEQI|nr:CDT1-like protein a, chloroplastic [Chenopodium quinoa]
MESSEQPLMIPFKSKKPLLTTPNKKSIINPEAVGPAVATPERANPKPVTRIRNQKFALSVSEVRRTALQLQKSNNVGSDLSKVGPEKVVGSGIGQKPKGSQKSPASLPQKYEMLCEFFNSMVGSIRLLRLRRQQPNFTKLAKSIESLTDRRFTLHHLAQLKHIMPEVIAAKKIRVQDDETKCMMEDLLLSLEVVALETDKKAKGGSGFSQLKDIFRSRIFDYYKSHHEDEDDVPEGELPQLFHQPKQEPEQNMIKTPAPLAASLTGPSFMRRFSSRPLGTPVQESMADKPSSNLSETGIKEASSAEVNDGDSNTVVKTDAAPFDAASTPAKHASISMKFVSTPAELASTPARLMAATPSIRPQKRILMTPDHDTSDLPNRSAKRRSLNFDESSVDIEDPLIQADHDESIAPTQGSILSKDDVLEILPEGLLQSLLEKERKILEENNPVLLQAKRRQQLMAGVPKLFDMILLLFKSINRSVVTKEELIYKLIAGHLDVVDRTEVEEQLKLLQEVAPEYISEQLSLSGDTLLRLNKSSCHESIRTKLFEAK